MYAQYLIHSMYPINCDYYDYLGNYSNKLQQQLLIRYLLCASYFTWVILFNFDHTPAS